jgi:hypothetical protein
MPAGHDRTDLPAIPGDFGSQGSLVLLSTSEPDGALYALLSWARRNDVCLTGLVVTPPTLEDIYLKLAGAR